MWRGESSYPNGPKSEREGEKLLHSRMLKLQMLKYDSLSFSLSFSLGVPSVFQPLSLILVLQDVSAQFFILPPFLFFFFHLSLSPQISLIRWLLLTWSSVHCIKSHLTVLSGQIPKVTFKYELVESGKIKCQELIYTTRDRLIVIAWNWKKDEKQSRSPRWMIDPRVRRAYQAPKHCTETILTAQESYLSYSRLIQSQWLWGKQ